MKQIWRLILALTLAWAGRSFAQTDPQSVHEIEPPPQVVQPSVTRSAKGGSRKLTLKELPLSGIGELRDGIARQIQTIEEYGLDDANVYDAVSSLNRFIENTATLKSR
jgi:hypothetical protein